jgi:diaminopimelate epimerase
VRVTKAHAYGNDFLLVPRSDAQGNPEQLARAACDRHHGIGADGLVLYDVGEKSAAMRLFNADGSPSELSGNGLRCLGALVARNQMLEAGATISVMSEAGVKILELLAHDGRQYTFRASLGAPTDIRRVQIPVGSDRVTAIALSVGNPQCVVLGPLPDSSRFNQLGPAIATHAMFPAGTNVEFAHVEAADRIRILIWERGVGPTKSSGTGASAAAVAAAAHGGAGRTMDVIAPGGTQHVEWLTDGVYLTGWAEIIMAGEWLLAAAPSQS